jgi:hypothetical protein
MMSEFDTTGVVIDRREADRPGAHALIVGIDDYPYLVGGSGALSDHNLGLTQLSTAVPSALAFHEWLVERARLPVPLATSRLLLAPHEGWPQDLKIPPPAALSGSTDDFLRAATGWMQAARESDAEMAIFYFCGQKLQLSSDDDVLLFQNFGSPLGPSFRGSVSFANIFNGMGPNERTIAQSQVYFLDGSRHPVRRAALGSMLSGTTDVFDVLPTGPDRRMAGVFHGAAPGDQAYSLANSISMFTQAVIKGLDGAAAVRQRGSEWEVTTSSLSRWLGIEGDRLASEHGLSIAFRANLLGDGVLTRVDAAPPVRVVIRMGPAAAAVNAELVIEDERGNRVSRFPDVGPPIHTVLPAGFYALSLVPKQESAKTSRRLIQVLPPVATIDMDEIV